MSGVFRRQVTKVLQALLVGELVSCATAVVPQGELTCDILWLWSRKPSKTKGTYYIDLSEYIDHPIVHLVNLLNTRDYLIHCVRQDTLPEIACRQSHHPRTK